MRDLGIVAIVRNQAIYLGEWIRYHRAIGVDQFYLYDNESSDDTAGVARRFGCQVIPWPGRHMQQLLAHQHALTHLRDECQWLAFIDPDEFIFAPGRNFVGLLRERIDAPALAMCWACFGTSSLPWPKDGVLRSYLRRAADCAVIPGSDPPVLNRHVKSVIQPAMIAPHLPKDPHHFLVTTRDFMGRRVDGPFHPYVEWQPVRLNHYISRSIGEAQVKMRTPRVNNNELYGFDLCSPELNRIKDNSMVPWLGMLGV
jgi:O-antigen biosynthesis protein